MTDMTPLAIDHIIFATPDLDLGVERLFELTGLEASPGGTHPQWGTRNAVVILENQTYLEVIGPDPARDPATEVTLMGIQSLAAPCLVTWVARTADLERAEAQARAHDLDLGRILAGSRAQSDGTVLSWRLSDPEAEREGGVLPFFLDWGTTPHPALAAKPQGALVELTVEHPEPARIQGLNAALGLDVNVAYGAAPAVTAVLSTPRGNVELR